MIKNIWLCVLLLPLNSIASETSALEEIEDGVLIFEKFENAFLADSVQEIPTEYEFADLNLRVTISQDLMGQRLSLFNLENRRLLTSLLFDHAISGIEAIDKKLRISIRSPKQSEIATATLLRYKYQAGSLEQIHGRLLARIARRAFKQVSHDGIEPLVHLSSVDQDIFKQLPEEIRKAFAPYVNVGETNSPSKPRRLAFFF